MKGVKKKKEKYEKREKRKEIRGGGDYIKRRNEGRGRGRKGQKEGSTQCMCVRGRRT